MFLNLEAEMARTRLNRTRLSKEMGITLGTLSLKLSGKSDLTLKEAMKIKKLLGVPMPIEELFEEEDTSSNINNKNPEARYHKCNPA